MTEERELDEQNPLAQDSYETKAAALSTIDGLTIEDCIRYFEERSKPAESAATTPEVPSATPPLA